MQRCLESLPGKFVGEGNLKVSDYYAVIYCRDQATGVKCEFVTRGRDLRQGNEAERQGCKLDDHIQRAA